MLWKKRLHQAPVTTKSKCRCPKKELTPRATSQRTRLEVPRSLSCLGARMKPCFPELGVILNCKKALTWRRIRHRSRCTAAVVTSCWRSLARLKEMERCHLSIMTSPATCHSKNSNSPTNSSKSTKRRNACYRWTLRRSRLPYQVQVTTTCWRRPQSRPNQGSQ